MTFVLMVVALCVLHKAYFIFVGIGLWFIDLFLRMILICIYKKKIKKATLTNLPGNIIRLVFEMNENEKFRYKSGQYVCICIPEVSCYEWHPLSISSSPHENEFSLHFSVMGSWTKKIQDAIKNKGKPINKNNQSMMGSRFQRLLMGSQVSSKLNFSKDSKANKNFSRGNTKNSNQSKEDNN